MKKIRLLSILITAILVLAFAAGTFSRPAEAQSTKFLGNIWRTGTEPLNFTQYWNQVSPENSGKWTSNEPNRDQMDQWLWLDRTYNYAKARGIPFKLHTLVWGHSSGEPGWVCSLPAADQAAEVEEWIAAVFERYPDIDMVDVVNEPLHDQPCYKDAIGGNGTTGWDWVLWSFQKARQYCPDCILILNDYNIINSTSSTDQLIAMANIVKNAGIPLALGEEAHGFESLSTTTMQANLDRMAAAGYQIYITEYDIDRADDAQQLQIMQQQFPIFWQHPAVRGVTLWGYVQGETWRANTYLQRSDGTARPALTWLMGYIGGTHPTATRTNTPSTPVVTNIPTIGASPTRTPTATATCPCFTNTPTRTSTAGPSATRTRTPTSGPSATRTNTPAVSPTPTGSMPPNTPTRTSTATSGPNATPTATPPTGGVCSPVTSTISSIPFTFDGAGTFCWQASSLGGYINSWNTLNVSVNAVNFTNIWVPASSLPAKINGFYYVAYNSSVAWGHFEAKP